MKIKFRNHTLSVMTTSHFKHEDTTKIFSIEASEEVVQNFSRMESWVSFTVLNRTLVVQLFTYFD